MATFKAPTVKPGPGTYKSQPVSSPSKASQIIRWGQPNPGMAAAAPKPPPTAPAAAPPSPNVAPAAAPTPTDAALPPDATYEQVLGGLQRKRDADLAALTAQRTTTLLNYGYNEGPNGALTYDPNNPESLAAQMKKHYDQSRSGTGINMAARGQLYAGSYQNAQDTLNRGQLSAEDRQTKTLAAYLAGNTSGRATAQTNFELNAGQALGDRVARAPQNPLYSPQGDQPGAPAASGSPSPGAGGPAMYSGPKGLVNGKYVDKDGGIHATQTVKGKKYYLAGSGRWVPIG